MARENNEAATVADYMTTKMITMGGKDSVLDVAKRMAERNISSVAITDEKDRIIGILTERDIVKIVANAVPPNGITAGSLMSPVVSIEKGSSVEDAARIMAQKKVRHLLVEDPANRQTIGIVTITDLARYLKQNLADEELAAAQVWELFS